MLKPLHKLQLENKKAQNKKIKPKNNMGNAITTLQTQPLTADEVKRIVGGAKFDEAVFDRMKDDQGLVTLTQLMEAIATFDGQRNISNPAHPL